ncbi:MAG: 3-oxo-5-alpha-steroid 4-dehydrogenase [Muribaculaceae bacterium]|nr:3-oxo-5-alpha-steroid 4-dehydrogenase [Muribaculaceae bacterium]
MVVLAVIVFVALQRITPAYGLTFNPKWGPAIDNRIGWVLMEAPVFFAMLAMWLLSPRRGEPALIVMTSLFLLHYFQRSFIFPMLIKGKSKMPISIILSGVIFNLLNAYMIGGWFFYLRPAPQYPVSWLWSPLFILGTVIFFAGMAVNIHSDSIIRNLRRPGDTGHYIPRGGMFRFVASANYFGELTEWIGFAILTWSPPGAIFALWTFANLAPRARATHKKYTAMFGDEYARLHRRYILPFIY